jgi:hypothetical protein
VGTAEDATRLCADATARLLVAQARQCGVWPGQRADRTKVAKTFAAYASGGGCDPNDQAWARADKWLAAIAKRPDRAPVKGYRRALPSEIPDEVKSGATATAGLLSWPDDAVRPKIGATFTLSDPRLSSYKLLVENHADSKVGVSVLVLE